MIVAGLGWTGAIDARALAAALAGARALGGGVRPDRLAVPADRAEALAPVAAMLGVAVVAVPAAALRAIATPSWSAACQAARGVGSVAEAAALAAAGPGARLIVPRLISPDRRATCALAQGDRA
ncbi:cobalamin biosynthesis protein [Sphingomonas morindae]|uniref:Cobalamin biosynthesis protein n=1 Tax=Sphingomonas morindae TaxID=1541170 RepID=A0ABY4X6L8_9SPHN|nr:cobalamin biosynthesis protein [Sphingomonas morindae]USI72550.1 cobalamin biosynthesis protein [Sphingomonas morindae]